MLLKVNPIHLKEYKIKEVNFLPARFDVGPSADLKNPDIRETFIVTYTGKYRVHWNLRKLKTSYLKGTVEEYGTINPVDDIVTDHSPELGRPGADESVIALAETIKHLKL